MALCAIPQGVDDPATYVLSMLEIPLWIVPILIVLGSAVGLVLSIVPLAVGSMVNWLWPGGRTRMRPALQGGYVAIYAAAGLWVHHALGVAYARALAEVNPDGGCSLGGGDGCPPIDGRHGWIVVWIVAGLIAYAVARGSAVKSKRSSTGWGRQLLLEGNG